MRELFEIVLPCTELLTENETRQLLEDSQAGDPVARERLVHHNLRLVMSIVQRFVHRGKNAEDLYQIGCVGLLKAIDGFDLERQVQFSTYAVPRIVGEIKHYLREDQPIRVSRSMRQLAMTARALQEKMTQESGASPTPAELAEVLEVSKEELVAALESIQAPMSLQEPIVEGEDSSILLEDRLSNEVEDEQWVDNIALREALGRLSPRMRQLVILRFIQDKTQTEAAGELELSQAQVSRLEKQVLYQLRDLLADSLDGNAG
ncbi:MAG: SigB/SigF/SigG family RNA polymerase sigma factor [Limnochordia bacterium]|nr:SigB/SigF/SigG family RNA polymerase sigma factor [Limnochordia bacterium]